MKLEVAQKILAATLTHARGRSMQALATTLTVWREEPSIIARNSWLS